MKTTVSTIHALLIAAILCLSSCTADLVIPDRQTAPAAAIPAATRFTGGVRCTSEGPYRLYQFYVFEAICNSATASGYNFLVSRPGGDETTDFKIISKIDNKVTIVFYRPGRYTVGATVMDKGIGHIIGNTFDFPEDKPWIDGPDSVKLGENYTFWVNYWNPNYPNQQVTLNIEETTFNDPQYTIEYQSNYGEYIIRFDQAGSYKITADIKYGSNLSVPEYHINVFEHPKFRFEHFGVTMGDSETFYTNRLYPTESYLNKRIYFTYHLVNASYKNPHIVWPAEDALLPDDWHTSKTIMTPSTLGIGLPDTKNNILLVTEVSKMYDTESIRRPEGSGNKFQIDNPAELIYPKWEIWFPRDTCYGSNPYKRTVIN